MRVTIAPSVANGTVVAPPSKSVAHRALICGALSQGCTVCNVAYSQDIEATLRCLSAMGATICRHGDSVTIGGLDPFAIPADTVLDCGESGSTLRFLLPLCLLAGRPITLMGSTRLMERPLGVYETLCRERGMVFERGERTVTVCGRLRPDVYRVSGKVSSQFITGLLLALPLLQGDSCVEVVNEFESASYVNLTLAAQNAFGVSVEQTENRFSIKGRQIYKAETFTVEGDCSNAAFLDGFNLLGGDVKVFGLSPKTAQGDWVYKDFYLRLRHGQREFDLSDCPDLGPVMFALSGALGGARFTGTARLRVKESDRVDAMAQELAKFGVSVIVGENIVTVCDAPLRAPSEVLCGHNDHRVVMALSLLCAAVGGTIDGAEAVEKSYPDYFNVMQSLRVNLNIAR